MYDKLTKKDIEKMEQEVEHRKLVVRKEALEDVKEARAHGDLSENFEYKAAKKFLRDAKLQTRFADFIFEEVAQRLDDFLEIHIIRETADVVVGLDHCGFSAKSGLYHIRVDGSLCQEIHGSDLLCLFLEDTDEFLSDNFTFFLRFCHTGKFSIITLLRVDTDKVQVKLSVRSEDLLNLVSFVLSEQTVIDEYASKLFSDCTGKKSCCNRRIHTSG